MFSMLVAVALLKAVIVPELARFTVPPALLVIPVIVPVPLRFTVPVLVKFARAVEIWPAPVLVIVPALVSVVMEEVPPRLRVPIALLVMAPPPENAVPAVMVPLLVYTPAIVSLAIEVFVAPPKVMPVPENVWIAVSEVVKVLALFVKLFW